ncbi:MAG: T9SS type A sorting domain-containing protein [Bacteroidia bacterium]
MKSLLFSFLFILSANLLSQAPTLYFNFVSHNEPKDSLQKSTQYFQSKAKCIQLANIIKNKNAAWNLGTCDYFVDGAINNDNGQASPNDIFEILSSPTYTSNIEIDPRTKNHLGRNTADAVYLINSCGGFASNNLSGFTYWSSNPMQIDWWQYQNTLTGNIYSNQWKATLIWGGGSPGHINDLNDYGIWKPDTTNNFYVHNPNRNLWFEGNGCAGKLDTLTNEQDIITKLRNIIDSLQNGFLPQNKFYCYTTTLGQDEFGTTLFTKISKVCDSINSWGSAKIQWATLSQKFTAFQNWQTSTSQQYSQWMCGQTVSGVPENTINYFNVSPNPSTGKFKFHFYDESEHYVSIYDLTGKLLSTRVISKEADILFHNLPQGLYFAVIDGNKAIKLIIN